MDWHTETSKSQHTENCKNLLTYSMNLTCKGNEDASGHPDSLNATGISVLVTVCCITITTTTAAAAAAAAADDDILIIFILFHKSSHQEDVEMVT